MEEISSKAAVNDALRPIRAINIIATTITAHRLDRAVMDLVNVQKVFSEYAERLEAGTYIELDGWQDHLEASYHASADLSPGRAIRSRILYRGRSATSGNNEQKTLTLHSVPIGPFHLKLEREARQVA
jgi:hypothetical protein